MILLIIVIFEVSMTEGRVYCQDMHATKWQALGYSCPITCKTILSAVDRLKQVDYQNLVNLQTVQVMKLPMYHVQPKRKQRKNTMHGHGKHNTREMPSSRVDSSHDKVERIYSKTYNAFIKIVQTEEFFSDFRVALSNLTIVLNITCYIAANRSRLLRDILNDCSPKETKGYILRSFMQFLNKYADPVHRFDVSMTLIVLKHLLSNSNFRYGMMEAILVFLKRALKPEERGISLGKEENIRLSSKHCLSMFISGCYCSHGFVEKEGQCVRPEECSKDPVFVAYLHRVKIK